MSGRTMSCACLLLACTRDPVGAEDDAGLGSESSTAIASDSTSVGATSVDPSLDTSGAPATVTTDDATATDTSGADDSTGTPEPTGVPLFVAQGFMGRTTISCDRGQSWILDQSLDDEARCDELGDQCYFDASTATGLSFGAGAIVATWGYGIPDTHVARTQDGVTWDVVATGASFGGIAFGGDVFVAGARQPQWSDDAGLTWSAPVDTKMSWDSRGIGYAPGDGGRFVIGGGGGGDGEIVVSSDGGASWWRPDAVPPACGDAIRSIVGNEDTIVVVRDGGGAAELCVSHDHGTTFVEIDLGQVSFHDTRALWTGEAFVTWSEGAMWSSADGDTWDSTPTSAIIPGPVARDDEGTFVAVSGWPAWYETQQFYRSADGVTWDELPPGAFVRSHPIQHIAFGYVEATDACG